MGRKSRNSNKVVGQAANPRGQDHLRAVQTILNAQRGSEEYAVQCLDWLRAMRDEQGETITDRELVCEAVQALREKLDKGYVMHRRVSDDDRIVAVTRAIIGAVTTSFDNFIANAALTMPVSYASLQETGQSFKKDVELSVNTAVTTQNLNGGSYRFEDDDDDEN
ncbi:MAG: hypothetical protein J0M07_03845 [Anaerolineae bacterium]|nr:hypothetical protein [Anaerolineae bacterium]